jgi:superkiller protein 3
MGSAYENLCQDTDALDAYRKAVAVNPNDAAAYYRMGVIYAGRGQFADASAAFEKVIAIEPTGEVADLAHEMSRRLCGCIGPPDTE